MTTQSKRQPTYVAKYKAGTFTGEDGKQRNAYRRLGDAWVNDAGIPSFIRIEALPVHWDGVIRLFPADTSDKGDDAS